MAEPSTEKPQLQENQAPAKQAELQVGAIGYQAVAGVGAGTPPLDSSAVARIQRSPHQALRSDMLALQRAVGNRAVAALVRGESKDVAIQAKLQVGPVNDVYEQEADKIARMVTSGFAQRKPAPNVKPRGERDDVEGAPQSGPAYNIKRMVQRKGVDNSANSVHADGSFTADSGVHDRIRRMEQSGSPLPDKVRQEMEPRFGADLGGVRIHTGGDAVQLSRDINARAFTHGSHIAFGAGGFNPNSQAGRQLLAHELTHTIQQTGARPLPSVQRSPKGVIQRGPTWEKVKNFFSRKKPEPVPQTISAPIIGTAPEIQAAAYEKAKSASQEAKALSARAITAADTRLDGPGSVSDEMAQAGQSAKDNLSHTEAKKAVAQMGSGDTAAKSFLEQHKKDIAELREKVANIQVQVFMNGSKITGNNGSMKQLALQSHALVDEAEQLVESMREQVNNMDGRANTERDAARSGLKDTRSLPAAEKSASDSVLSLMTIKSKVDGYYLYLATDLEVLKEHVARKGGSISENFSEAAAMRAMGSGMQRAESEGDPGMLDDHQAFDMGGRDGNMEGGTEEDPEKRKEIQKAETEAGMLKGGNALKNGIRPLAPLSKPQKKFAKQVKRLELRAMLYAKAQKRMPLAKDHTEKVEALHQEATAHYAAIDQARSENEHGGKTVTPEQINIAISHAGSARESVAKGTVHLEKMRKFKQEVYEESQKYEKYVGQRAMSSGKRKAKKLLGIVAGGGLRALTGGMYRVEAADEAGGYRVNLKSVSIVEDMIRKHHELQAIVSGLDGSHVKGLGGKHGARAYAVFKGIAFGLQIARDIASAVALWVTIVTGGAGAPVGAVFATIALYAALAKAAIDLLLLIWSGVGLANTNDPRSRSILRGENVRQGLALGEGAFAGASAGMMMGLSGSTDLLVGSKQGMAFGAGSQTKVLSGIEGHLANAAVGPVTPVLGNLGQNVGVNNFSSYVPHASTEATNISEKAEKSRTATKAIRVLTSPIQSGFSKLGDFVSKKKNLRTSKFAALIPEIGKTFKELTRGAQEAAAPPPSQPQGAPQSEPQVSPV
jgi:hypothetical protein